MPALLVLHGITMSGPSMLRTLGPIADALRAEGLELIAPNAGVRLGAEALAGFVRWAERAYAARGQVAGDVFRAGGFWEAEERGEHYDWFAGATVDGLKTFAGLEAGLDAIVEAVAGREDPIFPDEATIRGLAAELADPELHILDHLGHEVPRDPAWVARIAAFARAHAHAGA